MWLDRERELEALGGMAAGRRAEFVLLYGRRRVGKSELLDRFLRRAGGVRLLARQESELLQLRRFSETLAAHLGDPVLARNPLTTWDAFFAYLAQRASRRFVVAIDEFPYLVAEDRSLPSILQAHWDDRLRKTPLFLVLCGSSIGMMEDLMGERSPIYGRRTGQMLLRPLRFQDALPALGPLRQAVEAYAVFGGTPAYLLEYDRRHGLQTCLRDRVLEPTRFLYRDAEFVLRQEVREPRFYFSILHSIAKGHARLGEIVNDTGLDKGTAGKYLSVLSDLHLVEREVPVTEERPEKSRQGIYRLSDHFVRFWFRFVYPHIEAVERGRQDLLLKETILPGLPDFVAPVFERVAREAVEILGDAGRLPFRPERLGRWWDRNTGIDLLALGEGAFLAVEVKWSDRVNAEAEAARLDEKVRAAEIAGKAHFGVVARSFARRAPGALCLDLADLDRLFRRRR